MELLGRPGALGTRVEISGQASRGARVPLPQLPKPWRVAVARESPLRRGGPQPSQAGAAQEWDKTFLDPQPGARHRREGAPEVPGEAGPPRR